MSKTEDDKIIIELPTALYHLLRNEAKRQGVDLPPFIRKRIELMPADEAELARLPLREIMARTEPETPVDRLDFFQS